MLRNTSLARQKYCRGIISALTSLSSVQVSTQIRQNIHYSGTFVQTRQQKQASPQVQPRRGGEKGIAN